MYEIENPKDKQFVVVTLSIATVTIKHSPCLVVALSKSIKSNTWLRLTVATSVNRAIYNMPKARPKTNSSKFQVSYFLLKDQQCPAQNSQCFLKS